MRGFIQLTSLFMIFLVMSFPVTGSLSLVQFSGVDGFDGIVKSNDDLTILVDAYLPDQDVTENNVKLKFGNFERAFDSCVLSNGIFKCSFQDKLRSARGKLTYDINLYDDGDNLRDSVSQDLVVDAYGAKVKSLIISPELNDGEFVLDFVIEDYASLGGSTTDCSGIDRIEIFDGDASGEPISEFLGDLSCRMSASINYSAGSSSRDGKLCLRAYDRFSQSANVLCKSFEVDTDAPVVRDLKIEYRGDELKFIRSSGTRVDVFAILEGADKVSADLSALDSSNDVEVRHSRKNGDLFSWSGVLMTSSCEVTFTAEDEVGNEMIETLFCDVAIDDSPPVFSSFKTVDVLGNSLVALDGGKIIGEEGSIVVTFNEAQVGMNRSLAYLDLRGLGLSSKAKAKECVKNSAWECIWPVRPRSSGSAQIFINSDTRDDLGNKIIGSNSSQLSIGSLIVDLDPPVINNISHIVTHQNPDLDDDTIVEGDAIEFNIDASGYSIIFANLSALGIVAQPCLSAGPNSTCSFGGTITRSGSGAPRDVFFTAFDSAANEVSESYPVNLFGLLNDTSPNFWDVGSITCSPPNLDRQIASVFDMRVYCRVPLDDGNDADLSTVGFSISGLDRCEGFSYSGSKEELDSEDGIPLENRSDINTDLTEFFADHPSLMNTAPGSKNIYIVLSLTTSDFKIDGLRLTCPLSISSKVGTDFTLYPEVENITMDIGFYNNPAGEVSQELYDKIDDAIAGADALGSWLDDVQMVFDFVDKICQVRTIVWDVLNAVEVVINGLSFIIQAAANVQIFRSYADSLNSVKGSVCQTNQEVRKKLAGDQDPPNPKEDAKVQEEYIAKWSNYQNGDGPGDALTGLLGGILGTKGGNTGIDGTFLKPLCNFVNCKSTRCPPDQSGKYTGKGNVEDTEGNIVGDTGQTELDGTECAINDVVGYFGGATGYDNPQTGSGNSADGTGDTGVVFGKQGETSLDKALGNSGAGKSFVSPKDSLFWSLRTFCIPGVLRNLHKLRQVHCSHANCLGYDVKQQGVPVDVCEDEYSTMLCTYVANQVFNIFPQMQMWNYYMGMAQEIIANPAAAVAWVSGQLCSTLCDTPSDNAIAYGVCTALKIADVVGTVIKDVEAIQEMEFELGEGECERMEELKDDIEKEKKAKLAASAGGGGGSGAAAANSTVTPTTNPNA